MSINDAAAWPLQMQPLKLEDANSYKNMQSRVAKYVSEVLPEDEETIAREVRYRAPRCCLSLRL